MPTTPSERLAAFPPIDFPTYERLVDDPELAIMAEFRDLMAAWEYSQRRLRMPVRLVRGVSPIGFYTVWSTEQPRPTRYKPRRTT